jgi:hypothetical protein
VYFFQAQESQYENEKLETLVSPKLKIKIKIPIKSLA